MVVFASDVSQGGVKGDNREEVINLLINPLQLQMILL